MAKHVLLDAEHDDKQLAATFGMNMESIYQCLDHGEIIKFYCVDHDLLCCSTCAFETHRKCHEVNSLSKQVGKAKVNPSDLMSELESLGYESAVTKQRVKATKSNMQKQIKYIPGQIDSIKETLIDRLEKLKLSAMQRAKSAVTNASNQLDTIHGKATEIHNASKTLLQTLENVEEKATSEQLFIAVNVISKLKQPQLVSMRDQRTQMFGLEFKLEFDKAIQDILQTGTVAGTLTIDKRIDINDVQLALTPAYHIKLSPIASVDLKQTRDDQREPFYTGLTFLSDSRLVAVDNWNFKLYVMNDTLKKLGSPYKFDSNPQSVTAIGDDTVAVSRGGQYQINIIHISETNTITLTKTLKTMSQYYSLCLMNVDTFVVSTYNEKRPVRMISMSGEEKDFPHLPKKEYEVGNSACTFIRDSDILVFSDRYEHTMYLYDIKDRHATQLVVKDERIKEPRGVCVGPHGNVVVCSENTNSLVQVSVSGAVMNDIKIDMKYPFCVCMSPDGSKLAVSNNHLGQKKLVIYDMY